MMEQEEPVYNFGFKESVLGVLHAHGLTEARDTPPHKGTISVDIPQSRVNFGSNVHKFGLTSIKLVGDKGKAVFIPWHQVLWIVSNWEESAA